MKANLTNTTLLLIFLFISNSVKSQFIKSFNTNKDHNHYGLKIIDDDALMAGTVYPMNSLTNTDIHVQRVDKNGVLLWEKYIDIGSSERCLGISLVDETAFAISGTIKDKNIWKTFIMKIDPSNGNVLDYVIINPNFQGGYNNQFGVDIVYSSHANQFFLLGHIHNGVDETLNITALDFNLNIVWSKRLDQSAGGRSHTIIEIEGAGLYLPNIGLALDYTGALLWQLGGVGNYASAIYDPSTDKIFALFEYADFVVYEISDASLPSAFISNSKLYDYNKPFINNSTIYTFEGQTNGITIDAQSNSLAILVYITEDAYRGYTQHPIILTLDKSTLNPISMQFIETLKSKMFLSTMINHDQGAFGPGGPGSVNYALVNTHSNSLTPWLDGFGYVDYRAWNPTEPNAVFDVELVQTDVLGKTYSSCEIDLTPQDYPIALNVTLEITSESDNYNIIRPNYVLSTSNHEEISDCFEFNPCSIDVELFSTTYIDCFEKSFSFPFTSIGGTYITGYTVDWGDGSPNSTGSVLGSYPIPENHQFLGSKCSYEVCITISGIGMDGFTCSETRCQTIFMLNYGSCPGCSNNRLKFNEEINYTENQLETVIYPNPASNTIMLISSDKINWVNFFSINGKLIKQEFIGNDEIIDVTSFNSGIYIIEIHTDFKVERKKLVIK
ncbi:MAG: T9SS C-terminal target domain-containing protein [Bacteroidetes bacterium]|nr:MAG: T9SS C-terminal target domain-containing protein [Bacteroidota bacterium]MBL1145580.1 T9SS C-terminal target domain-containing protein [Bacteroidota bacterium]NOG58376.1 T9SS type A sorting domain-containing protein [Bacteroidota bacterium]